MIRGFNDDLMYADAAMDLVILISHLSCASIRYQGWILVGNHSHSPVWWAGWVVLVTEDQDLWGSHVLISGAEGTQNGSRNVRAHEPLRSLIYFFKNIVSYFTINYDLLSGKIRKCSELTDLKPLNIFFRY